MGARLKKAKHVISESRFYKKKWRDQHKGRVFFLRFLFIYFKQRKRDGEREEEKYKCVVASRTSPYGRPGLQPSHVPWLGIELATLWFAGRYSIHWATLARAKAVFKKTMATSFPELMKNMVPQIDYTLSRISKDFHTWKYQCESVGRRRPRQWNLKILQREGNWEMTG